MIGKLRGKIDSIFDEYLIIDVNGVGYRVFCSSKTLSTINVGEEISLFIQTIVKEDAIMLFGFLSDFEKNWFDILCKVNGIGNKMALKIMGSLTIDEMLMAIDTEDSKAFCRAPGIGQKIASRIIVELKDVRKSIDIPANSLKITQNTTQITVKEDSRFKDALSALENLGYQRSIAYNIIVDILKEKDDIVIESLITEALKRINNF